MESRHAKASVRDLVDHVDYVVDRVGIDHVGLSSDFIDHSLLFEYDLTRSLAAMDRVMRAVQSFLEPHGS